MRTLIVGQAPAHVALSDRAFSPLGASGRRLRGLLGPRERPFDAAFDTTNLLPRYLGRSGRKGDRFDREAARRAAASLDLSQYRAVVLCGRAVADAFGCGMEPFLRPFARGGRTVVVFPHPSPVSLWWNDPRNVAAARRLLRSLA